MDDAQTPGPWFLVADDGADFTAIATTQNLDGAMILGVEVLGSSGRLRAKRADLLVMAAAAEMLELLTSAVGGIGYLARAAGANVAEWGQWGVFRASCDFKGACWCYITSKLRRGRASGPRLQRPVGRPVV